MEKISHLEPESVKMHFKQFGNYENFITYIESFANKVHDKICKTPAVVKYDSKHLKNNTFKGNFLYLDLQNQYEKLVYQGFESKQKMINKAKFLYQMIKLECNYTYDRSSKKYILCLKLNSVVDIIQNRWLYGTNYAKWVGISPDKLV